jgi:predicted ATP-binding protein involved in virulence
VLLVDEVEAHLHPKWQRVIVPALMNVIKLLSSELTPQVHLATHSAMVMASTETFFDEACDDLHHLKLDDREVTLEELPFVKRGTVDRWLMSEVFELGQARSLEAEIAIDDAKKLQEAKRPDRRQVDEVNDRLITFLAPDDEFWPRWRYFAKHHGVK